MQNKYDQLRELLLRHATDIHDDYYAPWLDEKPLSKRNANKFILGAILDYQIKAKQAWDNARRLADQILGDPDSLWNKIVTSYTQDEWASKWRSFRLHRFPAAHDRIWRIGREIVSRYDGDARLIWNGQKAPGALDALIRMKCGEEISRMIVGWLITAKHLEGEVDVKADIHVRRVLGSVVDKTLSAQEAHQLARNICPANPWQIDLPLYDIGTEFCTKSLIYCDECPLAAVCITATIRD